MGFGQSGLLVLVVLVVTPLVSRLTHHTRHNRWWRPVHITQRPKTYDNRLQTPSPVPHLPKPTCVHYCAVWLLAVTRARILTKYIVCVNTHAHTYTPAHRILCEMHAVYVRA